jgi:hypothetical protein
MIGVLVPEARRGVLRWYIYHLRYGVPRGSPPSTLDLQTIPERAHCLTGLYCIAYSCEGSDGVSRSERILRSTGARLRTVY